MPTIAPYGSWKSPITSDLIVAETVGLGGTAFDGDDLYWTELRPKEGGRIAIVRRTPDGKTRDVTPMPFNARTRVHEYGGRAYAAAEGTVYFSNFADQRLYRQDPGAEPRPITPEADLRYADYIVDRRRNLLFCVREDHTAPGEAVNTLAIIKCDGDEHGGEVIVSGNNFYSSPRLSPDGNKLAWLTWNHPNMPWDGTELWVGEVNPDGSLGRTERVAGGLAESIFQPEWSPDGLLYFVSDRTGWWNLYRWREGRVEPLCPLEAEFGQPQWVFSMSTYAFESAGRIICAYAQRGGAHLARLDAATLELEDIETPYTDIGGVRAAPGRVLFTAGSPTETWSIVLLDLAARTTDVLRRSSQVKVDPGYLSSPQEIQFPTEGSLAAYAFYYLPRNQDFVAPAGEKPPLIVMSHGGPTGATSSVFSPGIQYWTSRGFAVLDVNYGGSTGYGRAYRQRLNGNWGVVDVDDCVNGARYLVERGAVDGERLAITGGSAGGYTTLCAITFRNVFKAGASHFGIGDLEAFAKDTHKFESRYLDNLVGPYPARRDLYVERSPIHYTHKLACALILFQGLEDKIVPPNQAQMMYEAVRAKELPVAYLAFEGEQHGFRKAENIKRTLDAELYFYSRVFKFQLADPVEPVKIENL
ncbi:MAG TPA: S9 family peptidase [Anaerolineales bacterium]|nr:S9 family peptidase [Anaerolineales bacterium]